MPLNRDTSERCQLIIGDNVSPGPLRYNVQLSDQRMKSCIWVRSPLKKQSFDKSRRFFDPRSSNLVVPDPQKYQKIIYETNTTVTVPKAERKMHWALDPQLLLVPGPGRYAQKR